MRARPTLRAPTILGEILRTTRSTITVAMATTAAIGAFAVLPMSAAFASGHDDDAPSTTTTATTAPADDHDEVEAGDQDEQETGDTGGSHGGDAHASIAGLHAVKIRATGSDGVRVTWELERGTVAATGYSIELRTGPKGRSAVATAATEPAGALQHVFAGLDPDTLYSAVVTAAYPDGTVATRDGNAARTDRTAERTVADTAAGTAEHAQHAAKKAAKEAAKAAKKAAKLTAHAKRHADQAARKAAKRATRAARHAAKVAQHAKHRADSAAKRAAKADRVADAADAAETESESEDD